MSKYLTDKEFIDKVSIQLDGFAWQTKDRANCRCPLCGDSKTNKRKRRGFFLVSKDGDGFLFKCHNCGRSLSVYSFLEEVAPELFSQYKLDAYRKPEDRIGKPVSKTPTKIGTKPKRLKPGTLVSLEALPVFHQARQYIKERKIPQAFVKKLFYTNNYGALSERLTGVKMKIHDERIVIPFYDKSGRTIAIQGRALQPDAEIRYISTKIDPDAPKIWGLDMVSEDETIWVMEGPFKAMFIQNCVAMAGSEISNLEQHLPIDKCVFVYDNEPRNREICRQIRKHIKQQHSVVIWNDCSWKGKDADDIVSGGEASASDLRAYLQAHTFSGLTAEIEFNRWCNL